MGQGQEKKWKDVRGQRLGEWWLGMKGQADTFGRGHRGVVWRVRAVAGVKICAARR
jgi:hypothetical protein